MMSSSGGSRHHFSDGRVGSSLTTGSFGISKEELISLHSSRSAEKLEEYGGIGALAKALVRLFCVVFCFVTFLIFCCFPIDIHVVC